MVKHRPDKASNKGVMNILHIKLFTMKQFQIILVAAFTISLAFSAAAQTSIGFRAAANLSNVDFSLNENGSELTEPQSRLGFGLGLVAEIGLSDLFAIQPELYFTQYGYRMDETFFDEKMEAKIRYNYLQLPLLGKVSIGSETFKVNFLAGPYFGYGIGDLTYEVKVGEYEEKESISWDEAENNRSDLGLTGGLGVSFGMISLDARYQYGLSNMIKEPADNEKINNRNFQVGLSFLIPLGK